MTPIVDQKYTRVHGILDDIATKGHHNSDGSEKTAQAFEQLAERGFPLVVSSSFRGNRFTAGEGVVAHQGRFGHTLVYSDTASEVFINGLLVPYREIREIKADWYVDILISQKEPAVRVSVLDPATPDLFVTMQKYSELSAEIRRIARQIPATADT